MKSRIRYCGIRYCVETTIEARPGPSLLPSSPLLATGYHSFAASLGPMPAFLPPLFFRRPGLQPAASAPIAAPGTSFRVFQPITPSRRGSAPAAPAPAGGTLPRGPGAVHVAQVVLLVVVAAALIACDVWGLHPWNRNVAQVAQVAPNGQEESQVGHRGAGEGGEIGGDGGVSGGSSGGDSNGGDSTWDSSSGVEYRGAPWKADVGRWLLACGDQLPPVTVGEALFSQACPGNCSGNGVCKHELGDCRCRHGFSGPDCSQLHLHQCNLPASPEWPVGTWVASICPAHCDTSTALCFCGNGTRFPHRPITHPCGFVYRSHDFVYSEVDTVLLFHAHTGYCNADPRVGFQRDYTGALCTAPATEDTARCVGKPPVGSQCLGFQRDYTGCGVCDVDGYLGPFCDVRVESFCANQCSLHGSCHRGYCEWDYTGCSMCDVDGFLGPFCDVRVESFCLNQCSLHGSCHRGYCECAVRLSPGLSTLPRFTCLHSLSHPIHSSLQCSHGFFGMDCSVPSAFTPRALFNHPSASLQLDSPPADVASTAVDAPLAGTDGERGSRSSVGDPYDESIVTPGDAAGNTPPGDVQRRRVLHGAGREDTHHGPQARLGAASAAGATDGGDAAAAAAAAAAATATAAAAAAAGAKSGWQRRVVNLAAQRQVKPFVRRQWEQRRGRAAVGSSSRRWVRRRRPLIYVYVLPGEFTFHHLEARKIRAYCTTRLYGMRNETLYNHFQLYGMEVSSGHIQVAVLESLLASPHRTTNATAADYFFVPVMGACITARADDSPATSMQVAVLESLLASPHRTTNASAADYFFVPVMGACITARADDSPATSMQGKFKNRRSYFAADYYQQALEHIRSAYPFWNTTHGRDHIWSFPWDEGACSAPKDVFNGIRLSHWGNTMAAHNHSTTAYLLDSWHDIPPSLRGRHPCFDPLKDVVMPAFKPPNVAHLRGRLWLNPVEQRKRLFFFGGNLGLNFSNGRPEANYSMGIRQRVALYFASQPNRHGHVGLLSRPDVLVLPGPVPDYALQLSQARFCGVFPGDGFSARMEDMRIAEADIPNLVTVLNSFSSRQVRAMQRAASLVWMRWFYRSAVLLEAGRQRAQGKEVGEWVADLEGMEGDDAVDTLLQTISGPSNSSQPPFPPPFFPHLSLLPPSFLASPFPPLPGHSWGHAQQPQSWKALRWVVAALYLAATADLTQTPPNPRPPLPPAKLAMLQQPQSWTALRWVVAALYLAATAVFCWAAGRTVAARLASRPASVEQFLEFAIPEPTPENVRLVREQRWRAQAPRGLSVVKWRMDRDGRWEKDPSFVGETAWQDQGSLDRSTATGLLTRGSEDAGATSSSATTTAAVSAGAAASSSKGGWRERLQRWEEAVVEGDIKDLFEEPSSRYEYVYDWDLIKAQQEEEMSRRARGEGEADSPAVWLQRRWWKHRPGMPYVWLLHKIQTNEVDAAVFTADMRRLYVTMKDGFPAEFKVDIPIDPFLYPSLLLKGVNVDMLPRSRLFFLRGVAALLPSLLLLGGIGAAQTVFKRRVDEKIHDYIYMDRSQLLLPEDVHREGQRSAYDDVVMADDIWEVLEEVMAYMRDPMLFHSQGIKLPRGILISGPPGTGKTLLARSIARECGLPFVFTSGAEFVDSTSESGLDKVFNIFFTARANAPAFLFVDEIDALAGKSVLKDPERRDVYEEFLAELDGEEEHTDVDRFSLRQSVILIAATNRPDELDEGLTKAGRIDREIHVGLPSEEQRIAIFGVHSRNRLLALSVDFSKVAFRTIGFSGADIRNLVNEAGIMAVRRGHTVIEQGDVVAALDKQLFESLGISMTDDEQQRLFAKVPAEVRRVLAVHEAGHVLLSHLFPAFDWHAFTHILPGGQERALSVFYPRQEMLLKGSTSIGYLHMQMVVAHGGMCAERLVFGDDHVTDNGQDDLMKLSQIAREIASSHANPRFGLMPITMHPIMEPPGFPDEVELIPSSVRLGLGFG
ncbi:unnamed protein product [Closterium sp. Naga37s-1]|nr:unnamed protein product [Closterium sp. Naga37s-1]